MEIHAPSHPLKSLKEFFGHILVVTVGILIALWFESTKEKFHERQVVREARENFRLDVQANRQHLSKEKDSLAAVRRAIDLALDDPAGITAATRKQPLTPGFYFFRSTSWDAALSTGALGHMPPTEVFNYADMRESVRSYSEIENAAIKAFFEFRALEALKNPSPAELERQRELLLLLREYIGVLDHLADELQDALDKLKSV